MFTEERECGNGGQSLVNVKKREAFGKTENGISTTSKKDGSRHFWRVLRGHSALCCITEALLLCLLPLTVNNCFISRLRINVVTYGNRLQEKKKAPKNGKSLELLIGIISSGLLNPSL